MKFPKSISHGLTLFGFAAAGAGTYMAKVRADDQKEVSDEISKKMDEVSSGQKDLKSDVKKLDSDMQTVKADLNEIKAKVKSLEESIANKSSKFISNFNLSSIGDIFNRAVEFFSSFDLLTQVLIFNLISTYLLSSLLFSFLIGKYGNHIIDRFNLTERYPRFSNILKLRLKIQKYYFTYITVLAIFTLLFNVFINMTTLLKLY